MEALYLLRHGPAFPAGSPDYTEDERPLTPEGRDKVRRIASGLDVLKLNLEWIVTSPLARARETAEIVAEVLGLADRVEVDEALRAGQPASAVRDWIEGRSEDRLMIVGHDPWISDLVGLLATGRGDSMFCQLRKGGVAAFAHRIDGSWLLDWLARPKLLCGVGE